MKKKFVFFAILAMALVFAATVIGCSDEPEKINNGDDNGDNVDPPPVEIEGNPFEGIWNGYDSGGEKIILVINDTDWTMTWSEAENNEPRLGIYEYSGNIAVIKDQDGYAMGIAAFSAAKDLEYLSLSLTGHGKLVLSRQVKVASVDDYADQEPEMTPNPNRKTLRVGGTTQIEIPSSLPSGGNATFGINASDNSIVEIVSQNGSTCTIRGLAMGIARITVNVGSQSATVIVTIVPKQSYYTLPENQEEQLGPGTSSDPWWSDNKPDTLPGDIENFHAEPTYQLAWNWRNPNQSLGASGTNCGIDILAYFVDPANSSRRGWVRTTYGFGGWHYDLNGVSNKMTNGIHTEGNVELKLQPGFCYDNGVPYLQITHILTNKGNTRLTGQKFGASADVMIYGNDQAPLTYLQYGALMTNQTSSNAAPSLKLRLVCQNIQGVDDVSTLWLGTFGSERNYVYADQRNNISAGTRDTALNFSYQNIDLNPYESKKFVVRFTQVQ